MIEMKLHGMKELEAQLKELEAKLAASTLAKAARKAFRPVLLDARRKAPKDTGLLRRRIKIQVIAPKKGGTKLAVGLRLSRRTPKGDKGKNARNWHWFEFGIPSRGIAAQPFFRSALDSNAARVLEIFKEELASQITQALNKRAGLRR